MTTDLFTTQALLSYALAQGLHNLKKTLDPPKARAVSPWYPLSLHEPLHLQTVFLSAPLCSSASCPWTRHGAPSFQGCLFLALHPSALPPPLRPMRYSLAGPVPGWLLAFHCCTHVPTQSTDNYWYAFSIKLQEIHLKLDLATIKWLVHIPESPQGGPTLWLLSPEALALVFCDSLDSALPCTLASSLFLQKDGRERVSSGSRRQNFSRSP